MSKNPYDVLGVSQNASDDEIKKAYRDLTRKYHPDANVNNPLADLAEEKFKEVQEAYDTIMNERASGSSGSSGGYSYGNGSYGGNSYGNGSSGGSYGGSYGAQADPRLQAAANYINSRRYREALNTLDQVQEFMDDAMMLGIPEVRILHGKGTGALKEEIRKYLRAIPLVSSAKDEQEQFGGAGITVVKLDV